MDTFLTALGIIVVWKTLSFLMGYRGMSIVRRYEPIILEILKTEGWMTILDLKSELHKEGERIRPITLCIVILILREKKVLAVYDAKNETEYTGRAIRPNLFLRLPPPEKISPTKPRT